MNVQSDCSTLSQLRCRRVCCRQHDDARTYRHTAVKVLNVLIGQTNATRRYEGGDRRWLIGPMDSIFRVAEIHGARAEGIGFTAGHEARQVWLALNHLLRWKPVRPLFHAA